MTDDTMLLQHLSACVQAGSFAANGQWGLYRAANNVASSTWAQMTDEQRVRSNDLFDEVRRLIDERLAAGGTNG